MEFKYSLPEIHFKEGDINISPKRRSTITTTESMLINFLEDQNMNHKDKLKHTNKPSKIDNSHLESEY